MDQNSLEAVEHDIEGVLMNLLDRTQPLLVHHANLQPSHLRATGDRIFLSQDYLTKELIIIDDGTDPIGDLVP